MIAGVAGALSILIQPFPYIDARSFTIALSIQFLVGMVIGGAASIVGPVIGAIFIERAPDFITDTMGFDASLTNVVYGVALILLMFVAPGGVVGLYHRLQAVAARRLGRGDGASRAVADAAFATPERLATQAASRAADEADEPVPTGSAPHSVAPTDLTTTKGTS
jgi:branched-chain amino acid transport system permease protein